MSSKQSMQCLWEAKAQLGEGARYNADTGEVWWVDIFGQKIFCLDTATGTKTTWDTPETVGCTFQCRNGDVLALLRHSIARLDRDSGQFTSWVKFNDEPPGNRFNDGTVGPDGALWVGSMDYDCVQATGKLYRVDQNHTITTADDGYVVANGPTFSPDGKTLYVNETMNGDIFSFDCEPATGRLSNKRSFAKISQEDGLPDGICMDTQGGLWVALVTCGRVRRYLPSGAVDLELEVPCPTVTSVCFGGKENTTLFITTGTILMDEPTLATHPLSGSLFSVEVPYQGLAPAVFAGS